MKKVIKITLLIIVIFICSNSFSNAKNYIFKVKYGLGVENGTKTLLYYQLIKKSGEKLDKVSVDIADNNEFRIKFKTKLYKEIEFFGSTETAGGERKCFLLTSIDVSAIKTKGQNNILNLIGATEDGSTEIKISELIKDLSDKRYEELLHRDTSEIYKYDNTYPIGTFIIYNPNNKTSRQAYLMPKTNPYFIELTRRISDYYVLKKKLGVKLKTGYKRLDVATSTDKQQFIEYSVLIDTMQILHWQSNISEMEYLSNEVNNGRLNFLKNSFDSIPELKFYFISSCVRIQNFTIHSEVHDSLGSTSTANLQIPTGTSSIKINAGVVYTISETAINRDETPLYYTGFGARDYTSYIKNLLSTKALEDKIVIAKESLDSSDSLIRKLYKDLRKTNNSLIDFSNSNSIISFSDLLNQKEEIEILDTMNADEIALINDKNIHISAYNGALKALKDEVKEHNNLKSNYEKLLFELIDDRSETPYQKSPEPTTLEDNIVENAISNKINQD